MKNNKSHKFDCVNKLTDIEWDTCWMAIRYAMNRQTIASATLPHELVENYYHRWTDSQKRAIAKDLAANENDVRLWSDGKSQAFGHSTIDRPHWLKFWSAVDIDKHVFVELSNGQKIVAFKANSRIYPLKEYVESPHREIYVLDSDIKSEELIVTSNDLQEKAQVLFNNSLDILNRLNEDCVMDLDESHLLYVTIGKNGLLEYKVCKRFK